MVGKRRSVVIKSIWAITIFFLAGCAPIRTVVDNIPTDQPKGYVEFYIEGREENPSIDLVVYDSKDSSYIGKVPSSFVTERRKCLRVFVGPFPQLVREGFHLVQAEIDAG